jgi:hypothetical protein
MATILNTDTFENINYRPFPVDRVNINVGERGLGGGFPTLWNKNMLPVDNRIYYGAPIGMTSSDKKMMTGGAHTPEHTEIYEDQEGGQYVPVQMGEGLFKSLKKGFKKAKKVAKVVKKGAKIVKSVAKVADKIGVPGASQVAKVAGATQKSLSMIGVGQDGTEYYEAEGGGFFKKLKKGIKKTAKVIGKVGKVAGIAGDVAEALGKEDLAKKLKKGQKIGKAIGQIGGLKLPEPIENVRSLGGDENLMFVATHPANWDRAKLSDLM